LVKIYNRVFWKIHIFFKYQCQSLSQFGIAQLAQYGIVGFRVLVIISCIAGTGGFIAGVASSDSVNIASTKVSFILAGIMTN